MRTMKEVNHKPARVEDLASTTFPRIQMTRGREDKAADRKQSRKEGPSIWSEYLKEEEKLFKTLTSDPVNFKLENWPG